MNKEFKNSVVILALGVILFSTIAFTTLSNQRFKEIDVERINIIEPDGTVKMIITAADRFPNANDSINNRPTNPDRKKRAGLIFFNEDGIECGGFIYDGKKNPQGHSAGLSLTYDQYDGDQVMQLLTEDYKEDGQRKVTSSLVFNERPAKETQEQLLKINTELSELYKTDPKLARKKQQEYQAAGLIGGSPRILLGQTRSQNNGLFLFDEKGMPKAMFYIDKDNQAKLEFYDEEGNILSSFPPK
ncbi:MAG: hypothetical protein JJT94_02325 [Bernardetiaceae bacterium]|nr:hypothetical protein [Bernardetiaceae bacterium]